MHDSGLCFIQHDMAVIARFVAERQAAVGQALCSIVHQAARDVLSHVLRIELIDIHHVPQGEAARSGIVKIFLGVDGTDAVIAQPFLIRHGLQHIPTHAVGLPCKNYIELPQIGIFHHALEVRAAVRFAADGAVFVHIDDGQAETSGQLAAFGYLLLNGAIALVGAGIPGIDDGTSSRIEVGLFLMPSYSFSGENYSPSALASSMRSR